MVTLPRSVRFLNFCDLMGLLIFSIMVCSLCLFESLPKAIPYILSLSSILRLVGHDDVYGWPTMMHALLLSMFRLEPEALFHVLKVFITFWVNWPSRTRTVVSSRRTSTLWVLSGGCEFLLSRCWNGFYWLTFLCIRRIVQRKGRSLGVRYVWPEWGLWRSDLLKLGFGCS